jgi:hypothetical protein
MKTALLMWIVVSVLTLAACNPTYIQHDYDQDADFNQYETFAWMEQTTMTEGTPQAVQQSGLYEARIKRAVNEGLEKKGLRLVDSEPDLFIAYHIGIQDYTEIRRTGTGWGYDRNTRVDQFQEGTFILDLIDANKDQLVWRGIAEGVLDEYPTPEKMDRDVKNMVQRLLKKYPPPLD